jgi:hypothetical protein
VIDPATEQLSPERNCDLVVPDRAARARRSAGSGGTGRPSRPGRAATQLTPYIANVGLYCSGGSCGAGFFTSTVFTSDGQDHWWNYMFVGVGGSSSLTLRSSAERVRLPGRTVVRPAARGRKGR